MIDSRWIRLDENRVRIENPQGIDAVLFAREDVPVESAATDELTSLLEVQDTVERFAEAEPGAFDTAPCVRNVALTPDFHTGSVSVGHLCGGLYRDAVRRLYPERLKHPDNGIFVLPLGERYRDEATLFWSALHNAANFAFANRLFLSLMTLAELERVLGDVELPFVYDAPHNLLWKQEVDGEEVILHRKGCCPARGYEAMAETPFAYFGEPVLVPGSMGASSFVLAGRGLSGSLESASHGAGRSLSRGQAVKGHDEEFRSFLEAFRVVTPVDLRRLDIRMRQDIVKRKLDDIKQEAPHAYKGIGPVVRTLSEAGIACPVARLRPLMTVKG